MQYQAKSVPPIHKFDENTSWKKNEIAENKKRNPKQTQEDVDYQKN